MKLDRPHLEKLRQQQWIRTAAMVGMWTLIGLIFSSQLYLFAVNTGYKTTLSYVLRWELTRWCLWALLTPWIVRFVRARPIQGPHLVSQLSKHLMVSILVSLIHEVLFSATYWLIEILTRMIQSSPSSLDFFEPVKVFKYAFSVDFHMGIFVYWSILLSILTVRLYRNAADLKLELTKAQLQALKMQIHPHFLFNTLNSISALLHKDAESADEMVGSLGDFLRLTLQNSGAEEVRLEKEIEFLKCYLEIEQIRFRDRLIASFDLDSETLEALVPNMLFQPIIENAIKHGIAERTDLGHISIQAKRLGGRLRITVQDDGPGLSTDPVAGAGTGIGLRNTQARLNHLYGSNHHFILENIPGGGLLVTVEIPYTKSGSVSQEESHAQDTDADRG